MADMEQTDFGFFDPGLCGRCGDAKAVFFAGRGDPAMCWDCAMDEGEEEENVATCYFCQRFCPDEDAIPADEYNGGDGGSICPDCVDAQHIDNR